MRSHSHDSAGVSTVEDFFPVGFPEPNIQKNLWEIGVEILNLPQGEVPQEVTLNNHTIGINLGPSHKIEQTIDGRYLTATLFPGCVGIFPYQLPMWSRWDRDVKHLYIHLEPTLLSRHSQELFDDDKVELVPSLTANKDLLIQHLSLAIKNEIAHSRNKNGTRVYVQSMADALAVHLLQNYSARVKSYQTLLRRVISS